MQKNRLYVSLRNMKFELTHKKKKGKKSLKKLCLKRNIDRVHINFAISCHLRVIFPRQGQSLLSCYNFQ